ncbi:glycoside hydrolase family 71/99-like protein [Chthoniobacter flavus]|uniref:glycoside hydrolase family 71/99-like protein n=1 Tax=Chthoniobacter flavus TaxID=191863 RepID=UPI00104B22D2|nr:glycoside hydrolase family 71/99-like protein [Chthoniobacter flavus]
MRVSWIAYAVATAVSLTSATPHLRGAPAPSREEVLAATLRPYTGESVHGVDTSTLTGKVMCGYQGWFNCEGDGANRGWVHWVKGRGIPSPSNIKVDLWPDVSELGADERFDTAFHHVDGTTAQIFSSFKEATVLRHFKWMRDYGIDGVFVQRFVGGARSADFQRQNNTVLAHCREGANRNGRTYALMYDLSGLGAGRMDEVIDDWRQLRTRMKLGEDPAYLHHRGKPVVAVWGIGFNDKRAYTLDECKRLIEFLKSDGCTVMLGVPTYWREQKNDAVPDPALHDIIALADIVSPWTVGRYRSPDDAARYAEKQIKPDIAWCTEHHLDYLPVLFPGFSWRNMYGQSTNAIPRRSGEFFWRQFHEDKTAGANMLYVAMFDEVDEGTAIFKCTNDVPPPSEAPFVTFEGLPSDYYLRLTGQGTKMLRGELPVDSPLPKP